ncbi:MAG: PilZ domain-containing protein [Terriglobales bacterium]
MREWLNDLQMSEESNTVRQFSYRGLRLFADFPVQLRTDEAESGRADARCVDISEEGMAVYSVVPLAIGARVVLRATFPQSNEPVTLFARVVNCHNEVYGLRFIFSSQGEKDAVSEFLATLNNDALPIRRSP